MKKSFRLLAFFAFFLPFLNVANAQGWEITFLDSSFSSFPYIQVFPGPNNGVHLAIVDGSSSDPIPLFNFDENGNYLNQTTLAGPANWELFQVDKTGATYWWTYYKIRKLDVYGQIEWTYNPPASAGIFWTQSGQNGSSYLQYSANGIGDVIDAVNSDGQLVKRFVFPTIWPFEYVPTADFGMIYTNDTDGAGIRTWSKLDKNGLTIWSRDFDTNEPILTGTADGATYFSSKTNELTKLDAAGNLIWSNQLDLSWDLQNILPMSDGSIVVQTSESDPNSTLENIITTKINAVDGKTIWSKQSSAIFILVLFGNGIYEMPDGGVLSAFSVVSNTFDYQTFILRTDKNGNTLTNQITGKIYKDENKDCLFQNTEDILKNTSVIAKSGTKTYSSTTDANGNFTIPASGGDYNLTFGQLGSYWDFCDAPILTLSNSNDTAHLNLGAKATVLCPEMVVSIGSPVFRRCFDNNYLTVKYQNLGTVAAENVYVNVILDPKLMYLSATAPLSSQNGQTFRFDIGTVGIGESGQFSINFKVDCNADLGEILCATSRIFPDTSCDQTAPPRFENRICLPVVASFDPNDKTAFVAGRPEFSKILPGTDLEYLVRFQNTGNDMAFNIIVVDTLAEFLDAASVVPGASSHPYEFGLRDGRILRFSFKNILLPDSTTNEPGSHGFVKFSVRQKSDNQIGQQIRNSAAIYFDFNAPVITNETVLEISPTIAVNDLERWPTAKIWPSPAHDRVQVLLENQTAGKILWKIFNVAGQKISIGEANSTSFFIARNGLPSGVYFCQFLMENGSSAVGRVVFD